MAKRIDDIDMPSEVTSGKQFDVTVHYTSDQAGSIAISYSGGFNGTPGAVAVPAGGSKPFKMKITRTSGTQGSCRVTFSFGNQPYKQPKVV